MLVVSWYTKKRETAQHHLPSTAGQQTAFGWSQRKARSAPGCAVVTFSGLTHSWIETRELVSDAELSER
jgi:hypothetical protein